MAQAFERTQVGKREELMDLISNIESDKCPMSSMMKTRGRPNQKIIQFQAAAYDVTGHAGVMDGADVSEFESSGRETLKAVAQKTRRAPAVSDFAEETEVAGAKSGEMAYQKAQSLVVVKRQVERRLGSNEDCSEDNGTDVPNETRGAFQWLNSAEQSLYPVPAAFRTPAASRFTGTLAAFTEDKMIDIAESIFIQRNGPAALKGFLGIKLKRAISKFSMYVPTVSNFTSVRAVNETAKDKALTRQVDRLDTDAGTFDLMVSSFMMTDESTGAATEYTHRSGLFLDMDVWELAYTRKPRIIDLEDRGGGPRAIVDAIYALLCHNPLGNGVALISADS